MVRFSSFVRRLVTSRRDSGWYDRTWTQAMVLMRNGDFAGALVLFDRLLRHAPDHPHILIDRSEAHAALNNFTAPTADLDLALQLRPGLARAYLMRGRVHRVCDDLERAMSDIDKAVEADPQSALALEERAGLHMKLGDMDRAWVDIGRAIDL